MAKVTKESIITQLKEKGLKITPQRLAIIDVLIEHRALHPGARLVYEEARKKKKSLRKTGFSVTDTRLEYYGLCRECRTNKGSKEGS